MPGLGELNFRTTQILMDLRAGELNQAEIARKHGVNRSWISYLKGVYIDQELITQNEQNKLRRAHKKEQSKK